MKRTVIIFFSLISIVADAQNSIPDFVSKPTVKWKFQINKPIMSSPLISEDLVYAGGTDSVFYALELATGKVKWKFRTKGAIRSAAVIDGSTLYLNGGDGNLYSMNKKTGSLNWTFAGKGEKKYDPYDYHHSTPVLLNGVLYFGSGDGNVYAIKADNGSRIWSYQTQDAVHSTPAIDNGKIYFGSFDGNVYAVNVGDGSLAWKFKTIGQMYFPKGEVQGSPAVYKGVVIIGARDFNVYAISQKNGTGLWNRYLTRGWGLVNTICDSVLHIGGADERKLFSVNPRNGREYWVKDMEFLIFGSNAYSQSMMYVGTTIGKLHGIDRKTGEKKWTFSVEGYDKNHLKYFKPDDTNRDDIYSIIKSNEQFLEVEYELGGIFSTPAVNKDVIVITTSDGTVYCLKR